VRTLAEVVSRNRTVITLFVLMVLLPAVIFSALITRAVRSERIQADYQNTQRQSHIVRLLEADLNNWLFSTRAGSAISKALLRFRLDGDQISFPEYQLSLPSTAPLQRLPLASSTPTTPITRESISQEYYPRIQSFLRDFGAGRHSGAQFFLRLRAVIVRPPGRDDGYVLDAQPLIEYLDSRLAEYCATEPFSASVRGRDFRDTPSLATDTSGVALGLEGFPFFEIVFRESEMVGSTNLRQHAFAYSMAALFLVTVLGSLFLYRAMSHEVRLSRLRTDFVAAVSHEFRSPLSSILALTERLSSARVHDSEKLAQYHQIIGQEARRLSQLVTRLLHFAQIEEGKKAYSLERVDLLDVAREAVRACGDSADPARIQLLETGTAPLWVWADGTALQHCIQNLIENGLKYSPPNAPVTIACASANGHHIVDVRDRGIGIPQSEQRKIFEKFYRGYEASELNSQGIGLGLALVKHIIDRHGGSIVVESQPGHGSCFRLLLPRMEA
jgi:signal transduction histidine kinase